MSPGFNEAGKSTSGRRNPTLVAMCCRNRWGEGTNLRSRRSGPSLWNQATGFCFAPMASLTGSTMSGSRSFSARRRTTLEKTSFASR